MQIMHVHMVFASITDKDNLLLKTLTASNLLMQTLDLHIYRICSIRGRSCIKAALK